MPMYEFVCETCGPFEQRRSMSEAGEPMECPACYAVATRVYSLPNLVRTSIVERTARSRNEQSADQPEVGSRPYREDATPSHRHPNPRRGPRRPWMVGH